MAVLDVVKWATHRKNPKWLLFRLLSTRMSFQELSIATTRHDTPRSGLFPCDLKKYKEEKEQRMLNRQNLAEQNSSESRSAVATPGRRSGSDAAKFMPKKRGRLGL